jgi:hypothetical protein
MLIAIVCHENGGVGIAKLQVLKLDKFIHIWAEVPIIMTASYPQRHISEGTQACTWNSNAARCEQAFGET